MLGGDLKRLSSDVRGDGGLADVTVEDVAHADVVGAIGDFADEWDDRRNRLADSLGAISDLAGTAAAKLSETDAELAKSIRDILEDA